jgi:hypothetical protein
MRFDTLQQIQQHQWCGNHYHDVPAFNGVHTYVTNRSNTMDDRAEAIRIMSDRAMGCGRCEHMANDELLEDYMQHAG